MLIVYPMPVGLGWHPITHMVRLLARCLGAECILLPARRTLTFGEKLQCVLRGSRRRGSDTCLLICPDPVDLLALHELADWRRRFGQVSAWVIDSFWMEKLPRLWLWSRPFDHLFVTSLEDVEPWQRATGTKTQWLPWGADALGQARPQLARPVDLLRVGRQPPDWDDDVATAAACQQAGLAFAGRPVEHHDASANQQHLAECYGRAKYLLAFSNLVHASCYTHPTREYLTARWTDALAGGATVAGVRPRSPTVQALLWPGATLELGGIERGPGLESLREALQLWRPAQAQHNAVMALRQLDWRWRFQSIALTLGIDPAPLRAEMQRLQAAIAGTQPVRPVTH